MNERYEATRRRRPATVMVALCTILALLLGGVASADNVDKLVSDLTTGSDYKLRLSAAASLAKLADKRAIPAFIKVLVGTGKKSKGKDKEKTVRGAAAVGLGKVVTSETSADLKKKAMAALLKASNEDKDSFVKKQAKKAYEKLKKLDEEEDDDSSSTSVATGAIYVDIGPMASNTGTNDDKLRENMKKTIKAAFKKHAPDIAIGEGSTSKGKVGYHVDGTLNSVTESVKSGQIFVACKVSGLVADYRGNKNPPETSIFGNIGGGAKTTADDTDKSKAAAAVDCVGAVLEDLVINRIIPAIRTRAADQ